MYPKYDSPVLIIAVPKNPIYYARPEKPLNIGRSPGNDIVIADPSVSRQHAIIEWGEKYPKIRDLNSTVGLVVDGKQVQYQHLCSKHQIILGNTKIQVDYKETEADTPTLILGPAIREDITDSDDVVLYHEYNAKDIKGTFRGRKSLYQIFKKIETYKRTGTLYLKSDLEGKILFGAGKIKEAYLGKHIGVSALYKLLSFFSGNFVFTTDIEVTETTLDFYPSFFIEKHVTKKFPH